MADRTDMPAAHPEAPPPSAPEANGFAIASLVLGIVWLMGLGSILALIFGYIAKGQIDSSAGRQTGRGLAVAGIVLGWVGVALVLAMVLFMVIGGSMPWCDRMGGHHD